MKSSTVASTLQRNIESVHRVRKNSDDHRRWDLRIVDRLVTFSGSVVSLYLHLLFYGGWTLAVEIEHLSGDKGFPFPLDNMGLVGTVEAIFLATLVLINQRRMSAVERKNTDLHLQVSMLAEHEISRLAGLVSHLAKHVGVDAKILNEFKEINKDIHPDEILEKILDHEIAVPTDSVASAEVRVSANSTGT